MAETSITDIGNIIGALTKKSNKTQTNQSNKIVCDSGEMLIGQECVLPVIVRVVTRGEDYAIGTVDAIFPTLPADIDGRHVTVLTEHGHSAGDYNYMFAKSRQATDEEALDIIQRAEKAGYKNMRIYSQETPAMRLQRKRVAVDLKRGMA